VPLFRFDAEKSSLRDHANPFLDVDGRRAWGNTTVVECGELLSAVNVQSISWAGSKNFGCKKKVRKNDDRRRDGAGLA